MERLLDDLVCFDPSLAISYIWIAFKDPPEKLNRTFKGVAKDSFSVYADLLGKGT